MYLCFLSIFSVRRRATTETHGWDARRYAGGDKLIERRIGFSLPQKIRFCRRKGQALCHSVRDRGVRPFVRAMICVLCKIALVIET